MNIKTIVFATSFTVILATANTLMAQASTRINQHSVQINRQGVYVASGDDVIIDVDDDLDSGDRQSGSYQFQQTTISLNSADLRQPHILRVSTSKNAKFTGQLKVNGRKIQTLASNNISINLSPRLSRGRNIVEISGNYSPVDSSVKLEFSGPNTQVNQQMNGEGIIRQTLIVDVR